MQMYHQPSRSLQRCRYISTEAKSRYQGNKPVLIIELMFMACKTVDLNIKLSQ